MISYHTPLHINNNNNTNEKHSEDIVLLNNNPLNKIFQEKFNFFQEQIIEIKIPQKQSNSRKKQKQLNQNYMQQQQQQNRIQQINNNRIMSEFQQENHSIPIRKGM